MKIQENLKRGMTELLILHLLKQEDMYGYQLTQEFEKRSDGLFILKEGTMYPSLYRLIEKGMISDHKELIGKRRTRVYYHIEDAGKIILIRFMRNMFLLQRASEKSLIIKRIEIKALRFGGI